MLNRLAPRERQIVDLLYQNGAATVTEIRTALHDSLTASAVRAMLSRLEAKGLVERRHSERGFLYAPRVSQEEATRTALGQLVRTFFNGSAIGAASALLDLNGPVDQADLDEFERLIAEARKGARK